MEKLPLFISLSSLLLWMLAALFLSRRLRTATSGIGLGLSFFNMGSAIAAAVRVFDDSPVAYRGVWFKVNPGTIFEVSFAVNHVAVIFWLVLSLFASALAYFALLEQIKGTRSQLRGEAVTVPLLAIGTLCALSSSNLITYYFGWALVSAAGFLAIGFSAPNRDERATASFRYFSLVLIPDIAMVAGILGCYAAFNTLAFEAINEKAGSSMPEWAVMCLVVGTMLRTLQMPFMQSARYLSAARSSAIPVLFIGHALLSSALFSKIYPAITAAAGIEFFAIIPALTAIVAGMLALSERNAWTFVGWLVSYVCASVFLSGLAGHFHAALALALTGSVGAFLLAIALSEFDAGDSVMRWFAGFAMLVLTGLPVAGWGWARYLEYIGLYQNEGQVASFHWILLGLKLLADFLMGIALWGVVRERWLQRGTAQKARWEVVVPLAIIAVICVSAIVGGRPFAGLLGQAELEAFSGAAWFERIVIPPPGTIKPPPAAFDLIGTDADLVARLLMVGMLVLPALFAGLWIFRDRNSLEEFRAFCSRAAQKFGHVPGRDPKLWAWLIRPIGRSLGLATAFFDSRVLDRAMADSWAKPARAVRSIFVFIEKTVIDKYLIDGLAEAIGGLGRSLRLVQNGQVQFYFALGLILMGAIVIKFVVMGG